VARKNSLNIRHGTLLAYSPTDLTPSESLIQVIMKILTEEESRAHNNATIQGAVEGAIGGTAIAWPGFYLLNRRWPYYRSLPPSLKVLGVIFIVVPGIAIQAERRGLEYDRSQWIGAGKLELDREAAEQRAAWKDLSTRRKVTKWLVNHQYSIMFGGWLGACAVAGSIIWKNKYQTGPQKLVQVRMWAQGLTIGIVLAAGILTHANQQEVTSKAKTTDHSWAAMLEEQSLEKERQKVKFSSAPPQLP